MNTQKPVGFEQYLSGFKPCIFDSWCGEPVAWGFEIYGSPDAQKFAELRAYGEIESIRGRYDMTWYLITKSLTRQEAIEKYGPITNEEFGPRGGWKSVTFGDKKFISPRLKEAL